MPNPRLLSFAIALVLTGASASAVGQSVHSAAGAIGSPSNWSAGGISAASGGSGYSQRSTGRGAPPLPSLSQGRRNTPSYSSTAPAMTSPAGNGYSPHRQQILSFEDALNEPVTIDVIDMALEDFVQKLTPVGWRLRFQHVSDTIKEKRVDFTAQNITRGDVLYALLGDAGLSVKPFEDFDTPLLLVSSAQ